MISANTRNINFNMPSKISLNILKSPNRELHNAKFTCRESERDCSIFPKTLPLSRSMCNDLFAYSFYAGYCQRFNLFQVDGLSRLPKIIVVLHSQPTLWTTAKCF